MTDLSKLAASLSEEAIQAAEIQTRHLQEHLDITNADHIALWLEANLGDSSPGWLACRIIEAHEQEMALAHIPTR